MKSDMAGSAAVFGAFCAVVENQLPVHLIALIPATDNRPGNRAIAPGDVITMHNGKTVEILNTDAEGRLVLADALSYAEKYNPEWICTAATLTGAAARAIGTFGAVGMGNAKPGIMKDLLKCGLECGEKVAEFPFWREYEDELKSDIADLNNLGSSLAGAITAGKFLEHFTGAPFLHLDIAGPAFLHKSYKYLPAGGTGFGVRLLYSFIKARYTR